MIFGPSSIHCIPKIYKCVSKINAIDEPMSVLWVFKDLNFETSSKKIMRLLTRKAKSKISFNEEDMFQLFVAKNKITWSSYHDVSNNLTNCYNLVVVQNFESVTSSCLVRLTECINSKGVIIFLFPNYDSFDDLSTISMDFHRTFDSPFPQKSRFMNRFLSSIQSCSNFIAFNDKWSILFDQGKNFYLFDNLRVDSQKIVDEEDAKKMAELHESLADTQPVGSLINCCRTLDQSKGLFKLMDILLDKAFKSIVAIKGPKGRGKSATLGLAVAGAIALNYSNIFVTSTSVNNLETLFSFILIGLSTLNLKQDVDFEVSYAKSDKSDKEFVSRILVFRSHQQRIQYISPSTAIKDKLLCQSAELMIIDEACAMPFDLLKSFFGPYLIFLSSTTTGFEASGKSRLTKLLKYLRNESSKCTMGDFSLKIFHELTLDRPILYSLNDPVDIWINKFLCLNISTVEIESWAVCPKPEECDLYYINRDSLFIFEPDKENFLQKLMALYDSTSYSLNPDSLHSMLDHPNHHLFCLLPSVTLEAKRLLKISEILCFVHLQIDDLSFQQSLNKLGHQGSVLSSSQICLDFDQESCKSMRGTRILKIATNPNFIEKEYGYGRRAIQLLEDYFKGHFDIDFTNTLETVKDKQEEGTASTLLTLFERKAESLGYIITNFDLNSESLRLWIRNGYLPIYLNPNVGVSGEYSLTMIKIFLLETEEDDEQEEQELKTENYKRIDLLLKLWINFRDKFMTLLSYYFKDMAASLAVSLLQTSNSLVSQNETQPLTKKELEIYITLYDLKRLEIYSQIRDDYRRITDLLPIIARFYFLGKMGDTTLSPAQSIILLSIGLQAKTIDDIGLELGLPGTQVLAHFYKAIKKIITFLYKIEEKATEEALGLNENKYLNMYSMRPLSGTLDDELEDAGEVIKREERENFKKLTSEMKHLAKYAIKGSEDDWNHALKDKKTTSVSIKT